MGRWTMRARVASQHSDAFRHNRFQSTNLSFQLLGCWSLLIFANWPNHLKFEASGETTRVLLRNPPDRCQKVPNHPCTIATCDDNTSLRLVSLHCCGSKGSARTKPVIHAEHLGPIDYAAHAVLFPVPFAVPFVMLCHFPALCALCTLCSPCPLWCCCVFTVSMVCHCVAEMLPLALSSRAHSSVPHVEARIWKIKFQGWKTW